MLSRWWASNSQILKKLQKALISDPTINVNIAGFESCLQKSKALDKLNKLWDFFWNHTISSLRVQQACIKRVRLYSKGTIRRGVPVSSPCKDSTQIFRSFHNMCWNLHQIWTYEASYNNELLWVPQLHIFHLFKCWNLLELTWYSWA